MSSSTDPYLPQEKRLRLTWSVLDEMGARPPDVLVIQTHHTLVERDLDLIAELAQGFELWISLTVETDMEHVPGFPPHASPPASRLETLKKFRARGLLTQATVSPLLPLANPRQFACQLDAACDRVILDHYLIGDGSPNGWRTKRTAFAELLEQAGFGSWNDLVKLWETRDLFVSVLGHDRVLIGSDGFNLVGQHFGAKPTETVELFLTTQTSHINFYRSLASLWREFVCSNSVCPGRLDVFRFTSSSFPEKFCRHTRFPGIATAFVDAVQPRLAP